MKKTIFIGDVHGCFNELQSLIKKVNPDAQDRIIFTGDLINKGQQSREVVKWVMDHGYESVMGNHEWAYLKIINQTRNINHHFLKDKPKHALLRGLTKKFLDSENRWINNLPLYLDEEKFTLVHAGILPNLPLLEHPPFRLFTIRDYHGKPWHDYYTGKKPIIYGHWAMQGLKIKSNSIGIDSACVYGGKLSALILETREIIQVNHGEVI